MNFDFIQPQPYGITINPRFTLEDKGKTRQLIIEITYEGKTWDLAFRVYARDGKVWGVVTTELQTLDGRTFLILGNYRAQLDTTKVSRISASAAEAYFREKITPELVNKSLEDVVKIILDGRDPSEESK